MPGLACHPSTLGGCAVESLNSECFCVTLDTDALRRALQSQLQQPDLCALIAQRYQGQTTNFRTPGGAFAPVYVQPPVADSSVAETVPAAPTRAGLPGE